MKKKQALEIIGGLSRPGKMPGPGYSIPAKACKIGSVLRTVENSACSDCYALKNRYLFSNVQTALYRRLDSLSHPLWCDAMVIAIGNAPVFRWHDSGDIQSLSHLQNIIEVCQRTPNTRHWLPTREVKLIREYVRCNAIPPNLTIRISATMIDSAAARVATDWNRFLPTSTIHDKKPPIGYECPAPKQGNNCGDCRACWDSSIHNISYRRH